MILFVLTMSSHQVATRVPMNFKPRGVPPSPNITVVAVHLYLSRLYRSNDMLLCCSIVMAAMEHREREREERDDDAQGTSSAVGRADYLH